MEHKYLLIIIFTAIAIYLIYRQITQLKEDLTQQITSLREDFDEKNNTMISRIQMNTNQCVGKIKNVASENLEQFRKITELNHQPIKKILNHFTETEDSDGVSKHYLKGLTVSPEPNHDIFHTSGKNKRHANDSDHNETGDNEASLYMSGNTDDSFQKNQQQTKHVARDIPNSSSVLIPDKKVPDINNLSLDDLEKLSREQQDILFAKMALESDSNVTGNAHHEMKTVIRDEEKHDIVKESTVVGDEEDTKVEIMVPVDEKTENQSDDDMSEDDADAHGTDGESYDDETKEDIEVDVYNMLHIIPVVGKSVITQNNTDLDSEVGSDAQCANGSDEGNDCEESNKGDETDDNNSYDAENDHDSGLMVSDEKFNKRVNSIVDQVMKETEMSETKNKVKEGTVITVGGKKKVATKKHQQRSKLSVNTGSGLQGTINADESYLTFETVQSNGSSESDDTEINNSLNTTDYNKMESNDLMGIDEYTVDELRKIAKASGVSSTVITNGKRRSLRKHELYATVKKQLK